MKHNIRLNQKRVWIDHYTKQPITERPFEIVYIGKRIVVVKDLDDEESAELIDVVIEETIPLNKVKRRSI